jgi:hypothetical protein
LRQCEAQLENSSSPQEVGSSDEEFSNCASHWRKYTPDARLKSAGKLLPRGFTPIQTADELLLPMLTRKSSELRSYFAKRLESQSIEPGRQDLDLAKVLPPPTVILKLDVEGSEWSALRSARMLLRDPSLRPVLIMTELWQRLPSALVGDLASLLLEEADYVACVVDLAEADWHRIQLAIASHLLQPSTKQKAKDLTAVERNNAFLVKKLPHLNYVLRTPVEVLLWHSGMNGEAGNVVWIQRDALQTL